VAVGGIRTTRLATRTAAAIRLWSAFMAHLPPGRVPNRLDLPALSNCCHEDLLQDPNRSGMAIVP
jgi:hypothetical protein